MYIQNDIQKLKKSLTYTYIRVIMYIQSDIQNIGGLENVD